MHGEIIERNFAPAPPLPAAQESWHQALGWAAEFWRRVAGDSRISAPFLRIAEQARRTLRKLQGN
jgi:hypothetical protein